MKNTIIALQSPPSLLVKSKQVCPIQELPEATDEVSVTNAGEVAGTEVVQLYVADKFSSVTRPPLELKGFRKVELQPGETVKVRFPIRPLELSGGSVTLTLKPFEIASLRYE